FVMRPIAGQGTVAPFVATDETRVVEFSIGGGPARAEWIYEMPVAGKAGVRGVGAVASAAFPINKTPRGCCRHAHGVVVIDHPSAAFADTTGAVIETNRYSFLRDVPGCNLESPKKRGTKVHALIRLRRGERADAEQREGGGDEAIHVGVACLILLT